MTYLNSFEAVHYRGIDGLSLPRLSRANLVTGVNGIGKTALLEAMWLFVGRHRPALLWSEHVHRSGNQVLDPVEELANGLLDLHGVEMGEAHKLQAGFEHASDMGRPVAIGGTAQERLTQLSVAGRIDTFLDGKLATGNIAGMQPTAWGGVLHENPASPPNRPNCIISCAESKLGKSGEFLQHYSDLTRREGKQKLIDALGMVRPKIRNIEILTDEEGVSHLWASTTDGGRLRLGDLGGGVVRTCRLFLNFFASRDGVLLVDELENGIHHAVLQDVWKGTRLWIHEWNVQLVATTHSAECIEAAMTAFQDAPEDLSIHKLFANEETGKIEAATFSGESLEGAWDLGLEVR